MFFFFQNKTLVGQTYQNQNPIIFSITKNICIVYTYIQGHRENRGYRGSTPYSSDRTGGRQGVIFVVFFEFW